MDSDLGSLKKSPREINPIMINTILIKGDPYQIRLEAWKGPWRASMGEGDQRHTARQQ